MLEALTILFLTFATIHYSEKGAGRLGRLVERAFPTVHSDTIFMVYYACLLVLTFGGSSIIEHIFHN